ncbi:MAG: serine/threonine protein kinase [Gammaproteobacteria bacterium]|jgi:Ser/Thr protein kinase RdoA (MazF antagonist)|nr:MAG: serine/threonine protein kinase [Gammaproteobacteria bacterium]
MTETDALRPFHNLSPDAILDAVEQAGYCCDGRVLALNSYENRVYQIGLEETAPIIAKFYRPARWSDAAILEEHRFTHELNEMEIPVATPLKDSQGETLLRSGPYRFALYPRVGGRAPELDNPETLRQLGRCLGRMHNVGAVREFRERPAIGLEEYVIGCREFLLAGDFVPADIRPAYAAATEQLIHRLSDRLRLLVECRRFRLHGDFHIGNILWQETHPFIVDFDDARTGPAIQDFWMLLSGDRPYMTARLTELLEGYTEFRNFDPLELQLLEPLRTLRIIYFSGWLARRWDDPAFPRAFPAFNTQRYWQDHILALREQLALIDEPPLEWHDWT